MAWVVSAFWLIFIAILAGHAWLLRTYLRWLETQPVPTNQSASETYLDWPLAAIVLSLRGGDEGLDECLRRLADLDYPRYELHIVLDHETDPSRAIVEQWRRTVTNIPIRVHFLWEISGRAYLKTSAIRQCLKQLLKEESPLGVAVVVDADTQVYRGWLRDMIRPMLGTKVGLVTGNRWYDPTAPGWGTLARFVYNLNAVAPMYLMRATWAGSLAIRREVFARQYFFDRMWDTSSEELAMQDATRDAGFELEIQPRAILLSRDSIGLVNCFRFIRRQLLWTRLHHREWSAILFGTAIHYLLLLAVCGLAIVAGLSDRWLVALACSSLIAGVTAAHWCFAVRMHARMSAHIASVQGRNLPPLKGRAAVRLFASLPVSLVVHTYATLAAAVARFVTWRGIRYQVMPPRGLVLLGYTPLQTRPSMVSEPPPRLVESYPALGNSLSTPAY